MKIFHAKKYGSPDGLELSISGNLIKLTTHHFYNRNNEVKAQTVEYKNQNGDVETITIQAQPADVFDFATVDAESYYTLSCEFDFAELLASSQAESGGCFNVYFGKGIFDKPIILNANAVSHTTRGDAHSVFRMTGQETPAIVICTPYAQCPIEDAIIGINTFDAADVSVRCNFPVEELAQGSDLEVVRQMVRPRFRMTGSSTMSQGGTDTFSVDVLKDDGSIDTAFNDPIYFETTGGILAVSKVKAVNGTAQVRLIGDHLIAGDVVTVKAGTKFFTSLAKMDVQVIA